MVRRTLILALFVGFALSSPAICLSQEYKIGIQAYKGAQKAIQEWRPTAEYLSEKLGKTFTIVPLTDNELLEGVKQGKIDFFFSNSALYAELNKLHNAQAIATMVSLYKNRPMDQMASSIITRKDSPINSIVDFRGKEFMTRAKTSFGGWLVVKRLFIEKGIDPEKDLKAVRETQSVQHVVYAVLNSATDGGAVIAGTMEQMADEGKINLEDFKVINQFSDSFPLPHSTQLYPEFPMAAAAHVPGTLKNVVASALWSLSSSDPAAVSARISGWKKPLDYSPVFDCLTIVQYGPFAKK